MNPDWQNNFILILFAAATLHGLYLMVIIAMRARKEPNQLWLCLALFGISSLLINYLLFVSDAISQYPNLLNVCIPFIYLTGPAFYLFVRKSADDSIHVKWADLLHLIPLVIVTWQSIAIIIQPASAKLEMINGIFTQPIPSPLQLLLGNRFNLITAAYALGSIFFLQSQIKKTNNKQLSRILWLRNFSIAFFALLLLSVIIQMTFALFKMNGASMELTITLLFAIAIHLLGYNIFKNEKSIPWASNARYATSPLDPVLLTNYKERITEHLKNNRPWLTPEFSVADLSSQLKMPRHHLSQVLNEEMNTSFNELVNSYRVQEAKSKLTSDALSKYSIIGIAKECGFASKSTFNRIFKKYTGVTPTSFIPSASRIDKSNPISS